MTTGQIIWEAFKASMFMVGIFHFTKSLSEFTCDWFIRMCHAVAKQTEGHNEETKDRISKGMRGEE